MTNQFPEAIVRKVVAISGLVQGVGFRPYVYRLANECNLEGFITNTPAGVNIEVQGPASMVEMFLERLPREKPPLARITKVAVCAGAIGSESTFRISKSERDVQPTALISPDVAVCADCLRELFDPQDRRYRYPFINCTNCGPRFTILHEIPYDRERTSMAAFRMCPACQTEYDDPENRRFHAQPNACWVCGPSAELWDARGEVIAADDPIRQAAELLRAGSIVAVKGLGGFHLACDAANAAAVETLRERKHREEKPFAVMLPNLEAAEMFCEVEPAARSLLLSAERPIVLLPWKQGTDLAPRIAPERRHLGVFLPYTPLHHLLFADGRFDALVMTSGNLSEEPIASDNREAVRRLGGIADAFLLHDREIVRRCDDSVVQIVGGRSRQLRRSRGYVPAPIALARELPAVLAVGGELKNTICMVRGDEVFFSQHVGDLENLESYKFFVEVVEHFQSILELHPKVLAHDLHPDYFSTRWALEQAGCERIAVQHHHAHVASCMAENHLDGRVIGIVLDGTGYGTDGAIWGGEVLLADYGNFERAAHLRYMPMPGGAAAIQEPWRMAAGCLFEYFGRSALEMRVPLIEQLDRRQAETILRMVERGVKTPRTSSCGRLFDAVAALTGVCRKVAYEAQAAIALEMCVERGPADGYAFCVDESATPWQIDSRPMIEELLRDIARRTTAGVMSRRFHNGLAAVLCDTAKRLREQTGLERVCLSGGCFQNEYLFEALVSRLAAAGLTVFTHAEAPAGDGGLALGQAVIAAHRVEMSRSIPSAASDEPASFGKQGQQRREYARADSTANIAFR